MGCILHVLLVGRPAFRGFNQNDIINLNKEGVVNYEVKAWSKVSKNALDLVQKMLTKDPTNRISTKKALEHPWFQF